MSSWPQIEAVLDGILDRRWYTNHGPAAQALEARCGVIHGVRHAVIATNPTIGLVMLIEALGLSGEIMLAAGSAPHCARAIGWAGLRVAGSVGPATSAVLCTAADDEARLGGLADRHGVVFIAHGLVSRHGPSAIDLACFGEDAGVACLLTDDDGLAARLRNIRSSYGAGPAVAVRRTANGRVSEVQAAMALLALEPPSDQAAQAGP